MKKIREENLVPTSIFVLFVASIIGGIIDWPLLSAISIGMIAAPFMGYMIADIIGGPNGK